MKPRRMQSIVLLVVQITDTMFDFPLLVEVEIAIFVSVSQTIDLSLSSPLACKTKTTGRRKSGFVIELIPTIELIQIEMRSSSLILLKL